MPLPPPRLLLARPATPLAAYTVRQVPPRTHPLHAEMQAMGTAQLQALLAAGGTGWDGMYYTLENAADIAAGGIELHLGRTTYATLRGCKQLLADGADVPAGAIVRAMGTAALVRTADGHWVFGRRGAMHGRAGEQTMIGGGLQPDEMEVYSGADIEYNMRKELYEEAGIATDDIAELRWLGIIQTGSSNMLFVFAAQLRCDAAELVERVFPQRTEEELAELQLVADDALEAHLRQLGSWQPLLLELL